MKQEFLIIGGGIAGLTTAIALKKLGIKATIIESAAEFKEVGAGITLASNALEVYKQLGIYEEVISAGIELKVAKISDAHGKEISSADLRNLGSNYSNLGIHRAKLHQVLVAQLEDDQIVFGKTTTHLEHLSDGERVYFSDGSSFDCSYLIVADGIHSAIRKQLIPNSKIRYAGYTCWRGISENRLISRGEAVEIWGEEGRFGYVPIDDNLVYWFATTQAKENSQKMKSFTTKDLLLKYQNYPSQVKQLIQSSLNKKVYWNDIIDLKPLNQFSFGRILLIGDAAHATTPNLGQGACLAIEDAWYLYVTLKVNSNPSIAFKMFETKRLKRTREIVTKSKTIGSIAEWKLPFALKFRNSLFRLMSEKQTLNQMRNVLKLEEIKASSS